jgi:hypothetical protein
MEDVFADAFRTMIDYWMNQESVSQIVTFLAVLELAIQSAMSILGRDGAGTSATIQGIDDAEE